MELHSEFEYAEWFNIGNSRAQMQLYLLQVWDQYRQVNIDDEWPDEVEKGAGYQGFLSFDGNVARAKNFIGFVQTEDCHIEIYPKIFIGIEKTIENKNLFIKHIFYWVGYCRKWKFPFTNVNVELSEKVDFPELIINLMASKILEILTAAPISLYREVEESLIMPRGRINFNRYISKGLTNGNQHILECDYEPLMFDNSLNRVIKYVSRILQAKAKFFETQNKLYEIILILDEVEDVICSTKELNTIKLNSFFCGYECVIDICRMVLEQQLYNHQHYEQTQWCLLFPMEYVFEDFVAGFLETHFSDRWVVHFQKSDLNLSNTPPAFQMRHDIFITSRNNPEIKIIIDTKYKIKYPESRNDTKKGISQSDMYQMTSYALRRGCSEVLLLYPNRSEALQPIDTFVVESGFDTKHKINITAAEIPFWSMNSFKQLSESLKSSLEHLLTRPSPKDS